jgi:RNA polymerase sigma-70 factor (ECF subfamily)
VDRYPLASIFLVRTRTEADGSELEALEAQLEEIVLRAAAAWSAFSIAPEVFVRYVADRFARRPEGARPLPLPAALAALHTDDLYLACACATAAPGAIEVFEARHLATVDHAVAAARAPGWAVDEVKQVLRCRFFLPGPGGGSGSIEDYSGHGSLKSWVSAAAIHAAFRVLATPKRQADVDSVVLKAISAPGDDLELEYLKRRCAGQLEGALRDAFASLTPRDRNILRCYHLEGAGIDGVAALYRVHRVTASRWVKRVTEELHERTRARLVESSRATRSEISSLLRLIQSQVDAVVRSVLAKPS